MDQPRADRLVKPPAAVTATEGRTQSGRSVSTVDECLDLLRISRALLLDRSPSEIAAITVSGQLREASDARRLLIGCALVAEECDLREQVHFEGGYFRVRISRS